MTLVSVPTQATKMTAKWAYSLNRWNGWRTKFSCLRAKLPAQSVKVFISIYLLVSIRMVDQCANLKRAKRYFTFLRLRVKSFRMSFSLFSIQQRSETSVGSDRIALVVDGSCPRFIWPKTKSTRKFRQIQVPWSVAGLYVSRGYASGVTGRLHRFTLSCKRLRSRLFSLFWVVQVGGGTTVHSFMRESMPNFRFSLSFHLAFVYMLITFFWFICSSRHTRSCLSWYIRIRG